MIYLFILVSICVWDCVCLSPCVLYKHVCVFLSVCCICARVRVCEHVHISVCICQSVFITLCFISLRSGFLLNVKLGWRQSSCPHFLQRWTSYVNAGIWTQVSKCSYPWSRLSSPDVRNLKFSSLIFQWRHHPFSMYCCSFCGFFFFFAIDF